MCLFLSPFVPCRTQLRHGRSALLAIKFALEDSRPGSRARSNLHLMDGSQKASVPTVRQTVKPPGKPDGPCFSPVSIFLLPIGQVLIMWNRTLYPSSSDWVLLWGPNWHCTHPATYLHHWDHCMGNWVIVPRSTGTRPLACLCLLYKMDYGFQATGRISVSGGLGGLWPWRTLLDFAVSGSGQNQALRVPPLHPGKNDGSPAGSHLSSGGTVMVPCVSPGMSLLSGVCGRRRVCPPTPPPPPSFHSHFVYGTWWLCK